jgi:putative selenium metabolism hydrolase
MTATIPTIDRQRLAALAQEYEPDMVRFLRDLIAIPAESGQERPVIERIRREMEKTGFDEIRVDGMGNILGRIGSGRTVIMMDSHTDTAGVGDPKEWAWDPYQGKVEDGYVYGRGASDQRGGMASMVYAAKIVKELALTGDYTLWIVGSVQTEDCAGLPWLYILKEDGIKPDCVVIGGPSRLGICRGHRGRMEIEVRLRGESCHAAALEMVAEVEKLNGRLRTDRFLGKGSIAVTQIVPGSCSIHLDRRLTAGETKAGALAELKALPGAENAEIEILRYDTPSYTGLRHPMEKYYPTWVLGESHPLAQAAILTADSLWDGPPVVDKWTTGTNGAATMGLMGVPTIGFGPGEEESAHTVRERMPIRHLVKAAQWYAAFPLMYTSVAGAKRTKS